MSLFFLTLHVGAALRWVPAEHLGKQRNPRGGQGLKGTLRALRQNPSRFQIIKIPAAVLLLCPREKTSGRANLRTVLLHQISPVLCTLLYCASTRHASCRHRCVRGLFGWAPLNEETEWAFCSFSIFAPVYLVSRRRCITKQRKSKKKPLR